ncbi:MAG: LutC/YkgG family protein [Vagococcus sp.]
MTNSNIQNREAFLENLHSKLGTTKADVSTHPFVPMTDLPNRHLADKTQDELLQICKERVEKIHTTLIETTSSELETVLADLIKECGEGSMMLPSDKGFDDSKYNFLTEGYKDQIKYWEQGADKRDTNITNAQNTNIAITFAEFLLAESGTVVVQTSPGQGRSFHFLPKNYISLIPKSKLVARSTQAANYFEDRISKGEKTGSAIHFISGPSNSGDIEMQLVVGLHGPVKVYYVVIEDE